MSRTKEDKKTVAVTTGKRKRTDKEDKDAAEADGDADTTPMEIDLNAPEPPSKKALRKMKKQKEKAEKKGQISPEQEQEQTGKTENGNEGGHAKASRKDKSKKEKGHKSSDAKAHERDATTTTTTATAPSNKRSPYGVWVGNLSFMVNAEELRNFLVDEAELEPEQITRLHMPKGVKADGMKVQPNNKGFAYVDFADQECVQRAIALSETELNKRRLLIKDANNFAGRPKKMETGPEGDGDNRTPAQHYQNHLKNAAAGQGEKARNEKGGSDKRSSSASSKAGAAGKTPNKKQKTDGKKSKK